MKKKNADSAEVAWFKDHFDPKDKKALKAFRGWSRARPCDDVKWDAWKSATQAWEELMKVPTLH